VQKAHEINTHLLRDLPGTPGQLDEMWHFIRCKQALQAGPDSESTDGSEDGRQGVWISFALEFRLILAGFVGPQTLDSALPRIQMTAAVVWGVPCFFRVAGSGREGGAAGGRKSRLIFLILMAVCLVVYIGLLYQALTRSGEIRQDEPLPPVFPLVLYNGRHPWTAPLDVADLIATRPVGLRPYHPRLRYHVLEERRYGAAP
jgi:hypothetical protein